MGHLDRYVELKRSVDRGWYIPQIMFPVRPRGFGTALEEYGDTLASIYRSVQRRTGCEVIVDSSKDPSHGFVLSSVPGIELYTLQLVRDSRAVSHSWTRKKLRPEVRSHAEYMKTYRPAHTAVHWLVRNMLVRSLAAFSQNYMLLRYEDLVTDPATVLQRIVRLVGADSAVPTEAERRRTDAADAHAFAGNPVRFDTRNVTVRPDVEWCDAMARTHKLSVTLITMPLLFGYGYLPKRSLKSPFMTG